MRDKKYRLVKPVNVETDEEMEKFEEKVKENFRKPTPDFQEYKVEATIPKLRVREAPNVDAEEIDAITKGQTVTIVDEKDGWGKTKFGKGWVNLKYARRV